MFPDAPTHDAPAHDAPADPFDIVDDTDVEPEPAPAEVLSLDARRIERVATLHKAGFRARSWQMVLVLFCWAGPVELTFVAWREWLAGQRGHAAVLIAMAGWLLSDGVRRYRRQRRAAAPSPDAAPATPLPEPDFSPLGDGSQRWRDCEQVH